MLLLVRRCLAALLVSLAVPVGAQQPLTLEQAQQLALGRSRQLVASDAAATRAREMAVAAGQLPDPVLKLGIENVPVSGPERFSLSRDFMTMRRIGVMQELTSPDKRRLRAERAERDVLRASAERQMATAEVLRESALAWIERLYAASMLDLAREQVARAQLQVEAADVAFRTGRGSPADAFAARAAHVAAQDKLRDLERQAQAASLSLGRWIGPDGADRPLAGAVGWRDPQLEQVAHAEHVRRHPHLLALQAQLDAAEAEVRLARANSRADWTVEAAYSNRGSAHSDMVSIGVSIPLQVDRANRQDREVAAAMAAFEEAQAKLEDALLEEQRRTAVLLSDWRAAQERLDRLARDLVPAARNRSEAALAAYRGGKGDLGSVLAAQRDELDARMQAVALETEAARLWARLKFIAPAPGGAVH